MKLYSIAVSILLLSAGTGLSQNYTSQGGAGVATADYATAFGSGRATGMFSTASGNGAQATGMFSTAIGASVANGLGSVALGAGKATGDFSFAANGSSAMSPMGFAAGYSSTAGNNWFSVAFGLTAYSSGFCSIAMGDAAQATGVCSLAFGSSMARGDYSTAIGYVTQANGMGQTVLGRYNVPLGANNENSQDDPLLIVGNGRATEMDNYTYIIQSNAMVITRKGDTTLYGRLAVSGTANAVLINPQGDLDMGGFTAGAKPQ